MQTVFRTTDPARALGLIREYADRIGRLARSGAEIVVLPEKFVGVTPEYDSTARTLLALPARQHHVTLVAGVNLQGDAEERNLALVYGPDGRQSAGIRQAPSGAGARGWLSPRSDSRPAPGFDRYHRRRDLQGYGLHSTGGGSTPRPAPVCCWCRPGTSPPTAGSTAGWRSWVESRVGSPWREARLRASSRSATPMGGSWPKARRTTRWPRSPGRLRSEPEERHSAGPATGSPGPLWGRSQCCSWWSWQDPADRRRTANRHARRDFGPAHYFLSL